MAIIGMKGRGGGNGRGGWRCGWLLLKTERVEKIYLKLFVQTLVFGVKSPGLVSGIIQATIRKLNHKMPPEESNISCKENPHMFCPLPTVHNPYSFLHIFFQQDHLKISSSENFILY